MRMLDNVIDINFYTIPEARRSNLRHRPVGLGLMGYQDALHALRIPLGSDEAVAFADTSMEAISYCAISASVDLAEERGRYASFDGSLWSRGILPINSIKLLEDARGEYLRLDTSATLDWDSLRQRVMTTGMRNSNVMAIAPTATISNIVGVAQSIEPAFRNLYVKANMSGDFTVVNPFLVRDLKARGLWDEVMISDLKYFDGSLGPIDRVPEDLEGALCHRLRDRCALAGRGGGAPPEVDRPGAVAQPLPRGAERPEARRALSPGLGAGPQDHLLPAHAVGDARREIDAQGHGRQAQRRVGDRHDVCAWRLGAAAGAWRARSTIRPAKPASKNKKRGDTSDARLVRTSRPDEACQRAPRHRRNPPRTR